MSIPTTQKATVVPKAHAPFELTTIDVPKPEEGEVLVRVEATALNPVDWKIQELGLFIKTYPAILGLEGAGTVEAVGEGVTDFKQGDRVVYKASFHNDKGAYQQYTLANTLYVSKVSPHTSSHVRWCIHAMSISASRQYLLR